MVPTKVALGFCCETIIIMGIRILRFVSLLFLVGTILLDFQAPPHSKYGGSGLVLAIPTTEDGSTNHVDPPPTEQIQDATRPNNSGIPQMCRDGGGVNIADAHVATLVDIPKYQSTCHCSESNTLDSLSNFNPSSAAGGGMSDILTLFNELIANLRVDMAWHCRNACATCFPSGDCAVIDVQFQADFHGAEGGLSLVGILSLATTLGTGGGIGGLTQLLTGGQTLRLCSEFASDSRHAGTVVCLQETAGVDALANLEQENGDVDRACVLEYNQEACASCTIASTGCIVADCSRFGQDLIINTCRENDSLEGDITPFQILPYYGGTSSASALTVGPCGNAAPIDVASATTADEL